ncbi:hypothetical protein [Isoptericola sp. NPDC019482]|uniref:hypothetical protein n=1 Tax=Isoptericola sp. NPDC019482 TaxID=3154688 RepID=UPI00348B5461
MTGHLCSACGDEASKAGAIGPTARERALLAHLGVHLSPLQETILNGVTAWALTGSPPSRSRWAHVALDEQNPDRPRDRLTHHHQEDTMSTTAPTPQPAPKYGQGGAPDLSHVLAPGREVGQGRTPRRQHPAEAAEHSAAVATVGGPRRGNGPPLIDESEFSAVVICPRCGPREVALTASGAHAVFAAHEREDHAETVAMRRARRAPKPDTPSKPVRSNLPLPTPLGIG